MRPVPQPEDYRDYVPHPRFGRVPMRTGNDPDWESFEINLRGAQEFLTPRKRRRIKEITGLTLPEYFGDGTRAVLGTAIKANTARQRSATVPVTHYYDLDKQCRGCGRRFIFFAAEQQHWYEELQLPVDATAVRCTACRKRMQTIGRRKKRYDALLELPARSPEQTLELVACLLALIDEGIFNPRQCQRVRMLLKRLPEELRAGAEYAEQWTRLLACEARATPAENHAPQ